MYACYFKELWLKFYAAMLRYKIRQSNITSFVYSINDNIIKNSKISTILISQLVTEKDFRYVTKNPLLSRR